MTDIIFEGPDNCGKSTAISYLSDKITDFTPVISGKRPETLQEYIKASNDVLQSSNKMYDRCSIISSWCYRHINELSIPEEILKAHLYDLKRKNNLIVFCYVHSVDNETVSEWDDKEYLDKISKTKNKILANYFDLFLSNNDYNVITFNYKENELIKLLEVIKCQIELLHKNIL